MRKNIISLFALAALLAVDVCSAIDAPQFQADERWGVLGDSITQSGSYHRYVELFYLTRFPAQFLDVINCGMAGDTAPRALQRLKWDCLDAKPTVVSVMFGMNDANKDLESYEQAMRKLTGLLLDSGAKVILIKPSIFDDTADIPKANSPGKGAKLAKLAERVQAIADEYHVPTVDFNTPLAQINREQQKNDPHFTIVGPDRTHPLAPGHLVMAYEFLNAQKLPAVVSRITIDAAAGKVEQLENCVVTNLTVQTDSVSFTCLEAALPFPVEESAMPALGYVAFTRNLNQETLLIRGLAAGNHELSIDGQVIRSFTADELTEGVNLAVDMNTPQSRQSLAVLTAARKKWEVSAKLRTIAYSEYSVSPDASELADTAQIAAKLNARIASTQNPWIASQHRQYFELKPHESELRAELAAAVAEIRKLSQPTPHRFELKVNR
jgi:lysophospholipase L1-like esterase